MPASRVAERVVALTAARVPFVHATVVRAQCPTSSNPGDAAVVLADGTIEGFVGGQCAESSVAIAARQALDTREAVLLRILPEGEAEFPESPGAVTVVNPCLSGGALEIFLEPRLPPPLLAIVGTTPIADAVATLAAPLGFATEVVSAGVAPPEGATAVIISSHGREEASTIRAALDGGVGFIGLVASRRRGAAVLEEMVLGADERARVHTPVGVDIGARTAEEIALSIVAEVVRAIRREGLVPPVAAPVAAPDGTAPTAPDGAVDPVCGMRVVVGPDTPHVRLGDEDHWFCSDACRGPVLRVTVTGLVLAAGSSSRLGRAKQLLVVGGSTLLGTSVAVARRSPLDQIVVAIGGPVADIRAAVDFRGTDVVEVPRPRPDRADGGCSSSIVAALDAVAPDAEGIVLLLGDQPEVRPETVAALIEGARGAPLGAVSYRDGRGHPLWFGREVFDELRELHGDKAVWKLLESGRHPVVEVDDAGTVPRDVDTWEDYEALVARDRANLGG